MRCTRVHGAGLCASLGIPGFVIHHSKRSDTVDGFKSEKIKLGEDIKNALGRILSLDVEQKSSQIIAHKKKYQDIYRKKLSAIL